MFKKRKKSVTTIERNYKLLRTVISICIAMTFAFLLILSVSEEPLEDFITFTTGPLKSLARLSTMMEKMIPLLFTGTAVCIMYSCNQINLSAEGAFFAGAYAATFVATMEGIPPAIHFILCALVGMAAGAIVTGIPALLHVKFGVMVVVSSLMINYVSLYFGLWFIFNILRDPTSGFEASYPFAESARLPVIVPGTRIHLGLIIGIAVVVLSYIMLYKSKYGYRIRTVGANERFAEFSGLPSGRTILSCQLLAGAIAGLGGVCEVLGLYSRFSYSGLTGHGWDGVMLAVLSANNPASVPIAAAFLAYVRTGADVLNRMSSVPTEIVKIVQSVVIVLVCAEGILKVAEHKSIVKFTKDLELKKGGKE